MFILVKSVWINVSECFTYTISCMVTVAKSNTSSKALANIIISIWFNWNPINFPIKSKRYV